MSIHLKYHLTHLIGCLLSGGHEKQPMVRGEERGGRLVYMYEPRSTFVSTVHKSGILIEVEDYQR